VDCLSWLVGPLVSVSGAHRTVITARPRLGGGELAQVDVDDLGTFVGRFEAGALGTFEVSQVATGRKNELRIELNGTRGSLAFDWERANELQYLSADDAPDRFGFRTILAGPQQPGFTGLLPVAGLGVGFLDAFITQAASFACAIAGQQPVGTLASFADGQRVVQVIQAVLESARTRHWVDVAPT
jgi:predicted dehydrogenase